MSKWLEIFLTVIYQQNMGPHKILGFSDNYFYYYIFLCAAWDEIRWITYWKQYNFASTSTNICLLGHKRPFGKVWHHSGSFQGVDLVQRIINWWSRVEIQLKWKNYQTNSEKSQTWWWLHTGHLKPWEKSWDQSSTGKHMDQKIQSIVNKRI